MKGIKTTIIVCFGLILMCMFYGVTINRSISSVKRQIEELRSKSEEEITGEEREEGLKLNSEGDLDIGEGSIEAKDLTLSGELIYKSEDMISNLNAEYIGGYTIEEIEKLIEGGGISYVSYGVYNKIPGLTFNYFSNLSGENITTLNATELLSGIVPMERIQGAYTGITGLGGVTFSGDVVLDYNELKLAALENLIDFPTGTVEGQMFWHTGNNKAYWYDETDDRWWTGGHAETVLVAAYNSQDKEKADYICDGTDDQVEIQAAIDSITSGGGTVALSEGIFNVSATITVPQGITLDGKGEQSTILSLTYDPDFNALSLTGGTEWTFVKNMELLGNAPAVPSSSTDGISISGSMVHLENLYIRAFPEHGIYANNFVHLRLINVYSSFNKTGSGVYLRRASISGDAANQIYIEGGNYLANGVYGIWLYHASNVLIQMVNFGSNTTGGLGVIGGTYVTVQNSWFEGNTNGVYIRTGNIGVGRSTDANEISLKNLVLYSNTTWDIDAFNAQGIRIEDCRGNAIRLGSNVSDIVYDHSVFTTELIDGTLANNSGTATVVSGQTFVDVTHGLATTPSAQDIQVTPTNDLGNAAKFWISNIGAATFRINVDVDPGVSTATFSWDAETD